MGEPVSATEVTYQDIQQATADPNQTPSLIEEDDIFPKPIWAQKYSNFQDLLDTFFLSNAVIIEEMTGVEISWEDMHHRSYFLLEIICMEN
jgi:hypothetical protein